MNKPQNGKQQAPRLTRGLLLAALLSGSAWAQSPTTQYEYDALGNPTRTLAPLGRTTTHAYDALRRPVQTVDPAGGSVRQSYDGLGQPSAVTDPRNLVTGYQYNGLGDLVQQTSPDTGTTQYGYDAAGNLIARTDAKGQTTGYQYDALNRPVLVTYHDGSRVAYGWDAGGRLAQLAEYDSAGQLLRNASLGYDAQGRLVQEIRLVAGQTAITGYLYANGRLDAMLYPSGRVVAYTYDAAGRVAGIGTSAPNGPAQAVVSLVQYHPFGGVKAFIHGNGLTHQRPLDAEGRLAGYSVGGQTRSLGYDLASRIVALGANSFAYDSLDRLVGAAVTQGSYGYSYDANGNRTAMTVGGTAFPYSIDAASNRLLAIGGLSGWNYGYDANGATLADGMRQYAYDARGRLVQVLTAQGTVQFEIDARGRRVRKSSPLGERQFHYDNADRLIAESGASGAYDREYLYLNDLPVAVVAGGTLYHIDPDHLGTPRLVTDGQGAAVWRWEGGEPFGAQAPEEDPNGTGSRFVLNLRFPGQYFDPETQLHYNFFRDYDPGTGRYVESDPIGLAGGLNTYAYVGGSPVSRIDPKGLEWDVPYFQQPGFDPNRPVQEPSGIPTWWAQQSPEKKCEYKCSMVLGSICKPAYMVPTLYGKAGAYLACEAGVEYLCHWACTHPEQCEAANKAPEKILSIPLGGPLLLIH